MPKLKNDESNADESHSDVRVAWINLRALVLVAIIGLIGTVLAAILVKTPDEKGVLQPVILVALQMLTGDKTEIVVTVEVTPTEPPMELTQKAIELTQTALAVPTDTSTSVFALTETAIVFTQTAMAQPTAQIGSTLPPSATPLPILIPTVIPQNDNLCPPIGSPDAFFTTPLSSEGKAVNAGTGILANTVIPTGKTPTDVQTMGQAFTKYPCVQYINPGILTAPNDTKHCMTSEYNTNRIWIGNTLLNASIQVRKSGGSAYSEIGKFSIIAPDYRNFLVDYNLNVGDEICMVAPTGAQMSSFPNGYHIWIGRDLLHFVDSICLIVDDNGTQHRCI